MTRSATTPSSSAIATPSRTRDGDARPHGSPSSVSDVAGAERPDAEEGGVAERDLAGVADEDVEAERDHPVDGDGGDDVARQRRHQQRQRDDDQPTPRAEDRDACGDAGRSVGRQVGAGRRG